MAVSRVCPWCGKEKEEEAFVKCKSSKYTYCKICHNKRTKMWRDSHPDKIREYNRKTKEKRGYSGMRDTTLKNKYGISHKEYEEMLLSQDGKCGICHGTDTWEHKTLVVDHCHTTGKVRGLLCSKCNKGLGNFRDSVLSLENAIKYLQG